MHLLFVFFGILTFEIHNKENHFSDGEFYQASVLEKPQEKENSFKSVIQISKIINSDIVTPTNEKALIYFQKCDSARNLEPGDVILFDKTPQIIKNYGNPFEFDYKKYLANKKIYRQVYLNDDSWVLTQYQDNFSLQIRAEQIREKLLALYRSQQFGGKELEILSALTLGYKRGLDPETKRIFSTAGAMHVLAVSGLHVGIIFWAFSLLFGFLKRNKTGRFLFVLFSTFSLWTYAFITGLSPSVMRAATMFTIFIIGDNLNRNSNIYNSLAASATLLLLINPNNLFEVGFQLSYAAVFGIVFLQPKLSGLIQVNNKVINFFWSLLTVSLAAQISTFPIAAYYFNQFPTYFWITNLLVIPAVMILIPAGMLLLLFANISFISVPIVFFVQFFIKLLYLILEQIDQLPLSALQVSYKPLEVVLLFCIFFSFLLILLKFSPTRLKLILVSLLIFGIVRFSINIYQINSNEIIVYNNPDNLTMHLISGKKNYIFSEQRITENDYIKNWIQTTNLKLKLDQTIFLTKEDSINNSFLQANRGLILFAGKMFLFNPNHSPSVADLSPDFLITSKSSVSFKNQFSENVCLVTNKRSYQPESACFKRFHNTSTLGAFIEKW